MSDTIQVGDTVQLKSGSPLMTVTDISKKGVLVCSFFDYVDGHWSFGSLYAHPLALTKMEKFVVANTAPFSSNNNAPSAVSTILPECPPPPPNRKISNICKPAKK